MNRLHLLGISYRELKSADLSKFHIAEKKIPFYLKKIAEIKEIKEVMLLSTCNRTEIYFVLDEKESEDLALKILKKLGFENKGVELFYHYKGKKALFHIFKVASSLDSMVIGENEITGQFKNAFEIAIKNKTAREYLSIVFREAMSAVKKIKSRSEISKGSISIGRTAVEILKAEIKKFEDKKILIVGAGYMGRLLLRALKENKASEITITNRTYEKAKALSLENNISSIPFSEFKNYLKDFDILALATSSLKPIINAEEIKNVAEKRKDKLYIIDIGIPRNTEKRVSNIKKVLLLDMDYIKKIRGENIKLRKKYLSSSLKIIKEYADRFNNILLFNSIFPTFYKMKESVMEFSNLEIDKMVRINKIDGKTEAILRDCNNMIMDKLIRRHISAVKKILDNKKIVARDIINILEKMIEAYD